MKLRVFFVLLWSISKPDTFHGTVRTAHTFVHHYNSTQYCNTEFFFWFPLPPDQHLTSDVAKWKYGGVVFSWKRSDHLARRTYSENDGTTAKTTNPQKSTCPSWIC